MRCENEINRAFNELYRGRRPGVIAYEDLAHLRGKAKSRGLSRKVSMWQRSIIKERKEYKNHVFGVTDPGPQNAAYSSQACPECGWVDPRNREGDGFTCRKCGFAADADRVAARNLKGRLHDEEITRHTPRKKVKQILLSRYRNSEVNSSRDVPGDRGQGVARVGESADGTCCRLTVAAREAGFNDEAPSGAEPRRVVSAGAFGDRRSGRPNRPCPSGGSLLGANTTPPFGSP